MLRLNIAFIFLGCAASILGAPKIPAIYPQIQGTSPHGAQRGSEVEVTIRGRNLQGATTVLFATPKIEASVLEAGAYRLKAKIRIAHDAEPGRQDFRVIAPHGSVNGWFDVGTRPEMFEKESNNDRENAQRVTLPQVVNGLINPGDYDYFRFDAKTGDVFTFDVNATRNGSPLDSVLSLLDESGAELAYSDDYYGFKDPHLKYRFDKDGTYYFRLYGSGESGSENSDYRLAIGPMPHVDHAMPLGGTQGGEVELTLHGVNLSGIESVELGEGLAKGEILSRSPEAVKVRLRLPKALPPGAYRLHASGSTLPVPFVISGLPELTVAGGTARSKKDPLPVQLPLVVNGAIDRPRGADYFSFRVDRPQTMLLQIDSMQLDYLLDPLVVVYDESGKRIAYQDEPTTNTGKEPATLDPHLVVALPKAGRYTAMVRDSQFRGAPTFVYRLTIKPAEPAFELTTIGMDDTLYRGRENIVAVRVRRLEGWNAPVEVWAENLPAGVSAPKMVALPENTAYKGTCGETHYLDGTQVELPFTVAGDAPVSLSQIRFRGRGVMAGRTVEQEARTRYWGKSRIRVSGMPQTRDMLVTIADVPGAVLATPEKASGQMTVIVTRLDGGDAPLVIEADDAPAHLTVEPVIVPAGVARAEVKVKSSGDAPGVLVLAGKIDGKIIGRSHPVVIEKARKKMAEVISDEN